MLLWLKLSGDAPRIGLSEARALCEARSNASSVVEYSPPVAVIECGESPPDLTTLGGFIKESGKLLWHGPYGSLHDWKTEIIWKLKDGEGTIKVDAEGFGEGGNIRIMRELGGIVARAGFNIDVKKPDLLLKVYRHDGMIYLALGRPPPRNKWASRDLALRPFKHPAMLKPKLARALVNLSRPRMSCRLLDPFSGTGGILIEASAVGCIPIGVEIKHALSSGSLQNLRWAHVMGEVIRGDAWRIPIRRADSIATDMPYGRMSDVIGESIDSSLDRLVEEMPDVLTGGYAAIMVRERTSEHEGEGARIVERHYYKEHDALTRKILVYRVRGN